MKVGIVGAGSVGSACAVALAMRGCAGEIVLVNRTRKRAKAVATDIRYGLPLSPLAHIGDGDYKELAGAALVMIAAGVNEKAGGATDRNDPSGRLDSSIPMPLYTKRSFRGWCKWHPTRCCSSSRILRTLSRIWRERWHVTIVYWAPARFSIASVFGCMSPNALLSARTRLKRR